MLTLRYTVLGCDKGISRGIMGFSSTKNKFLKGVFATSLSLFLAVSTQPAAMSADASESVVLNAMEKELNRSFSKLKDIGPEKLYFLSYSVYDIKNVLLSANYGALDDDSDDHDRRLSIALRVGTKELDNTHQIRGSSFGMPMSFHSFSASSFTFPLDDDEVAVRDTLWLTTDRALKAAQKKFFHVKANKQVKIEAEDESADFSDAPKVVHSEKPIDFSIDKKAWGDTLRKASAIYKDYPAIFYSGVDLKAESVRRFLVNSEGSKIDDSRFEFRVTTSASAMAKDGMVVSLFDSIEVTEPGKYPTADKVEAMVKKLATSVIELANAPAAQPYVGPAILNGKASGVFFHEVLGHRIEGHRQKDEYEGRTFTQKVGEKIMPPFISVKDDPTINKLGDNLLVGYYKFDDEGVASQKVNIVENGVLRNFLMARSPIRSFTSSNGHGRCAAGMQPVARQANLIVESQKKVPYKKLRAMLLAEAKAQHKPYGLVIDEIAGGFTTTQSFTPQSYSLLPLRVTKVFVDGRPDELTRGVNIVGTPLASLEKIVFGSTETATFNGRCGAESGWVPVSASSPSLLIKTIELEKGLKEQERPPILPPPISEKKK